MENLTKFLTIKNKTRKKRMKLDNKVKLQIVHTLAKDSEEEEETYLKNCQKGFLPLTALFLSKMIISLPSGSNESKSAKENFQFGLSPKVSQP